MDIFMIQFLLCNLFRSLRSGHVELKPGSKKHLFLLPLNRKKKKEEILCQN